MRISRQQMFMQIARTVALRSTCHRLNVGAVLVSSAHNVLSIGYNGAPEGREHCGGSSCVYMTDKGCQVIHAEANALRRDEARLGEESNPINFLPASLYVTHSPCEVCAKYLLAHSKKYRTIVDVYYEVEYRDVSPLDMLMRESTIGIFRLSPSGYLLDKRTGEVREV